jgi:antitoxin ParD1/3/4
MVTMNVTLPIEMLDFVENEVSSGQYATSSEVIGDALRLLRHEKTQQAEKLAVLHGEIRAGMDAAAEGRFSERSVSEIRDEVLRNAGQKPGRLQHVENRSAL